VISTLLDWFRSGGPIMYFILLCGLAGLAIFLERLYVIVLVARGGGPALSERVIQLVRAGQPADALAACGGSRAVVPDMGQALLGTGTRDEEELQNVADAASLAVLPHLTRRLQYLPMLANVATLLGLFGTIYGLREAFASVAAATAAERAGRLAAGIAVALNATGFGLLVAIPLTVAHSYLASQAEYLIEHVDAFAVRLINALVDRPDVRLGRR
jgi:biopolymer transport protein ExbB/TolQ